ncbi:MAG TPA: PD-(D/E)XK nuclease family protein [Acidimicrobiales bacterium]
MSIEVVTTRYGRPALRALRDLVAAAKGGEPLAPVTVVVPSNHVGVTARRLLAAGVDSGDGGDGDAAGGAGYGTGGGAGDGIAGGAGRPGPRGVAGVSFLTPYRLAELLGAPQLAAAGRRPVSTPVVAAALRRALARDAGVFAPVAEHPATETALVSAFAELSDVSPAGLEALTRAGRRAADVVRLYRQARATLAEGWYDESDLVAAAVEGAEAGRPPVDELGHVVVYLVQDLDQRQARLLRAVAGRRPTTVVAALTGAPAADAGVLRSLDRLGCPAPADPGGARPGGDPGPGVPPAGGGDPGGAPGAIPVAPGRTRVLTASDADEEVRAAVRAIVEATRQGTPLGRIAVLYGSTEPYGRLVHEHLAAAGIARNGTAVRPLAASAVGRLLLDLLALPDHNFRRSDVMGLLARSALRGPDGPAPVGQWERLTREAGVVAGRGDWDGLLRRLADGLDLRAQEVEAHAAATAPDPDPAAEPGPDAAAPAEGADGLGATQLALALDEPGAPAEGGAPAAPGTPAEGGAAEPGLADEPRPGAAGEDGGDPGLLDETGPDELGAEPLIRYANALRRQAASARQLRAVVLGLIDALTTAEADPQPWRARVDWVRDLAAPFLGDDRTHWPAAEVKAADAVEAALDRLATLDAIDAPPTLDVFRRTLTLELDADLGRVGRLGEGVLVAPLSFGVGLDLDLVVVLGMAEGTLPGPVRDDSLLPDGERKWAGGELPLRRDRIGRDQRHLWAALGGAERHLLCAPRGDLRVSNERVASRWLLAAASALHGTPVTADELGTLHADWLDNVPSFAHAVTHAPFPATEQDYRLRVGPARAPDPIAAAGAEVIAARRSRAFTRFDGNLAGAGVPSPTETTVSSTRLEGWAICPFAYFVRHLLRVEPVDDPERQLTITALDRGSLVHEVLDRFVSAVLARSPDARPGPGEPWSADDHATMAALAAEVSDDYEQRGLTGRPVFWRRDRAQIMALVDRFLREDDRRRRQTRTRPLAAELRFGRDGAELGPVEMALADGRVLRFSGAVDRLDVAEDGTLHVLDYKTGGSRPYATLGPDDPDQRGTRLQLAVYGQAARAFHGRPDAPVRAEYWFVSDREGFARKGYAVDDAVLERVGTTLTTIVTGIENGVFPARPEDTGVPWVTCEYCDPDGLGVTDLRRAWERKRDDPLVAPYAQLAEPRPDDEPTPAPAVVLEGAAR